ncbi:MAG: hypothetical protein J6A59_03880 [Lachnospiraceae bacterium]|nr:hypothetical protein [Lachnospiraceae bacterium]
MALKNNTQKAEETAKKEWKRILVPMSKLSFIYTGDNGKTSFSFALAEHDDITFMVSAKLVKVTPDHTAFSVALPVPSEGEEIKLSKSIAPAQKDGKWERKELSAEKIEDLGYPFEA